MSPPANPSEMENAESDPPRRKNLLLKPSARKYLHAEELQTVRAKHLRQHFMDLRAPLMKQKSKSFIVRVYATVECPGLLDFYCGDSLVKAAPETWHHLCVFENLVDGVADEEELRNLLREENLKDGFLNKWLLADVDGALRGNPYIQRHPN